MTVYISNREIEEIAEGLVDVLYQSNLPNRIDIDGMARYLGLNVVYESIAEGVANRSVRRTRISAGG